MVYTCVRTEIPDPSNFKAELGKTLNYNVLIKGIYWHSEFNILIFTG
jgi:hypothetical protein